MPPEVAPRFLAFVEEYGLSLNIWLQQSASEVVEASSDPSRASKSTQSCSKSDFKNLKTQKLSMRMEEEPEPVLVINSAYTI